MNRLEITGKRNSYSVDQCGRTLTVGELVEILQAYDDDTPIYINNDNGYTFGSIMESDIDFIEEENDEDDF